MNCRLTVLFVTHTAGAGSGSSGNVNRAIQQLAQKYCGECKVTFDELSKIIQVEKFVIINSFT